jgi:hypothetical protein
MPRPDRAAFPRARLRAARGLWFAYGAFALLAAIAGAGMALIPEMRVALAAIVALVAGPSAYGIWQLRTNSPRGGTGLVIDGEGVRVGDRLALPRASLVRAVVTRDARGVNVAIQRRGGYASVIDVASEEEGEALVRALGLDAAQALATFQLDSPITARASKAAFYGYVGLLQALFLVPIVLGTLGLLPALVIPWYIGLILGSVPTKLTIGLDGVLVTWLGRRELIRFADLRAVDHDGERLHLVLASGEKRTLSARWLGSRFDKRGGRDSEFGSKAAYLDAIVARVRAAIVMSRGAGAALQKQALLRQGRDVDAWIAALRGLLPRGAGSFREAETLPEQLWGTVEDGAADPEARAAAAIALSPALDANDRERLRGVARVVVAPRLRIAIDAVADGDDEAVREAMAALEETRREKRA